MPTSMTIAAVIVAVLFLVELLVLLCVLRICQDQKVLIRFLVGSKKGSLEKQMESSAISTLRTTPEK